MTILLLLVLLALLSTWFGDDSRDGRDWTPRSEWDAEATRFTQGVLR